MLTISIANKGLPHVRFCSRLQLGPGDGISLIGLNLLLRVLDYVMRDYEAQSTMYDPESELKMQKVAWWVLLPMYHYPVFGHRSPS